MPQYWPPGPSSRFTGEDPQVSVLVCGRPPALTLHRPIGIIITAPRATGRNPACAVLPIFSPGRLRRRDTAHTLTSQGRRDPVR
jgi:hypothetical protein